MKQAKRSGLTDAAIARLTLLEEGEVRKRRQKAGIRPVYKMVDTCAAEFEAATPYYYSTYEQEDEVVSTERPRVIVLGSGPHPHRTGGQFDYATVHAIKAIRAAGLEAVIINNSPETVSTDFNISHRLYFDPLYTEDVLNIIEKERPLGVVVQFGGQTNPSIWPGFKGDGVPLLGTDLEAIDRAEDRESLSSCWRSGDSAATGNCSHLRTGKLCRRPGSWVFPSWSDLPMCWGTGDGNRLQRKRTEKLHG